MRASSSAGLSVCWLKPPDDARILPNLKFVAINQLLSPLNSFRMVLACDYLRRTHVITAIQSARPSPASADLRSSTRI